MNIKGLNFVCTCDCCPEQYDVYDSKGNGVAYVRLRFGKLRCDYPEVQKETIYSTTFDDEWMGCFESEEQRTKYLNDIADIINERINN